MDVSQVASSGTGTVHCMVIGEVSPVKSSKNRPEVKYFHGQISDGLKTMRLVSFDPGLRAKLQEAQKDKGSVALQNCFIKRVRDNDNFEVHVNNKTSIIPSPKKFKVDDELIATQAKQSAALATVEEIKDVAEHQSVSLSGKVQSISPIEQVLVKATGKQLNKQEIILADGTAACRCVLWHPHTNQLKEGSSYNFENVTIRSYNGSKYLSAGDKALINSVADIGYVVDDLCSTETGRMLVMKAEVVQVISIDSYNSCRNCNGKITTTSNPEIGECTKCNSKLKISKSKSQSIARIILQEDNGTERKVTLFGEAIKTISDVTKHMAAIEDTSDLSDLLLMSPQLTYTVNPQKETVCSVTLSAE